MFYQIRQIDNVDIPVVNYAFYFSCGNSLRFYIMTKGENVMKELRKVFCVFAVFVLMLSLGIVGHAETGFNHALTFSMGLLFTYLLYAHIYNNVNKIIHY